jgi:hypothetical protein
VLLFGSPAAVICYLLCAYMADGGCARIADRGWRSLVAAGCRAAMGHGAWSPEANAGVARRLRCSAPCRRSGPGPALAAGSSPGERATQFSTQRAQALAPIPPGERERPPPRCKLVGGLSLARPLSEESSNCLRNEKSANDQVDAQNASKKKRLDSCSLHFGHIGVDSEGHLKAKHKIHLSTSLKQRTRVYHMRCS